MPDRAPRPVYTYTPPRLRWLRWLTHTNPAPPPQVRAALLAELFASPEAVLAGLANGLMLNTVAWCLHRGTIFLVFMLLDVAIVTVRFVIVRQAARTAQAGLPTATDRYIVSALAWCAVQGAIVCACVRTGIAPLQLMAAATAMGLAGPICARNYAAPRLAMLMVSLAGLPFIGGAVSTGSPWLRLLVLQTPLYFYGSAIIIKRFQGLSIATLVAQHAAQHNATHDSLTGVLNRRGLGERMAALAPGEAVLFCLDLDGFKQVNDKYGHQAGDQLLRGVADRLRACMRADDIVARLGGDEFIVVAVAAAAASAAALARSINERVTTEPYALGGVGRVEIGVSVGFACAPAHGETLEALYRHADAALYEAKRAGKGATRAVVASPRPARRRNDVVM